MAIKGAKTIAEYEFLRWMENEGFVMECFFVETSGNEAIIRDGNGDSMKLVYDAVSRSVIPLAAGRKKDI